MCFKVQTDLFFFIITLYIHIHLLKSLRLLHVENNIIDLSGLSNEKEGILQFSCSPMHMQRFGIIETFQAENNITN